MRIFFKRNLIVVFLVALGLYTTTTQAVDINQQRLQFQLTLQALQNGDNEAFEQLHSNLQSYPLYYYIHYKYLQPRVKLASFSEIERFLSYGGNTAYGNEIRQVWLEMLAKQGDWSNYLRIYAPQKSVALQCYYLQAQLATRQTTPTVWEDLKQLWLVGKSQPPSCQEAFSYMVSNRVLTEDLVWQRIRLAMQEGQADLASSIANYLPQSQMGWVSLWVAVHKNPQDMLSVFNQPNSTITSDIIVHGIKRIAASSVDTANQYWHALQNRYTFTPEQTGNALRELALAAMKQNHSRAIEFAAAVPKVAFTQDFNEKRFNYAFDQQNWRALAQFFSNVDQADLKENMRWWYWYGRALQEIGQTEQSERVLLKLANERDYYGFLAADRLGINYNLQHSPITFTNAEKDEILAGSIGKAYEFSLLGMTEEAKKEWDYGIASMSPHQQAIAAVLATQWGWYDKAILTAGKSGFYDDLRVRFPLVYLDHLKQKAQAQNVDLGWIYGVIRQESIFKREARSRTGAMGLMQLMPSTANYLARKLGLDINSRSEVFDVDTNTSLGTAYLREMLDTFDGNYMLATAAYNAGPGRAKRWAAERECLPADLWVELIPFTETRTYVKRVLFYTAVFESLLGQQSTSLKVELKRLKTVLVRTLISMP
ncbi:MAG: transglycosylase SLT domain-containing protein [Thiotrichaceae bacterium]